MIPLPILLSRQRIPAFQWDFTRVNGLPPGTTFTRTTSATYFDANGVMQTATSGVPRFDYDPVTHVAKGLLIEEQRTNRTTNNKDVTQASWVKTAGSLSGTFTAPDGASTGIFVEDGTNAGHYLEGPTLAYTIGTPVAFLHFFKPSGRTFAYVSLGGGTVLAYGVNLTTLATYSVGADTSVGSVTAIDGGWIMVRGVYTNASTFTGNTTERFYLNDISGRGTNAYTGDGASGIAFWGMQQESGSSFPTSSITTGAASATRNADVATLALSPSLSAPVSGYAEWDLIGLSPGVNNAAALSIGDGATRDNFIDLLGRYFTGTIRWFSEGANSNDGDVQVSGSSAINTVYRGSFALAANDFAGSLNGAAIVSDTSVTAPAGMTTIGLGVSSAGATTSVLNGHLRVARVFRGRIGNNDLVRMTA